MAFNPTIVVKVSGGCNLACKYCSLQEFVNGKVMSEEVLEDMTKKFIDKSSDRVSFIWHGGEPLLAEQRFFQSALDYQKKYNNKGLKIRNSIQTNGIMLDDYLIDFFKQNRFHVGLSYDGPKDIHDANRVNLGGKGTHDSVAKKLRRLREKGMKTSVVTVLTRNSIGRENDIYRSLTDLCDGARLNIFIPIGQGEARFRESYITNDEAKDMYINFYNLWSKDTKPFKLKPMEEIVKGLITGKGETCEWSDKGCSKIYSVSPDGDVYICGRLSGLENFTLGNISRNSFDELLSAPAHCMRCHKENQPHPDCQQCEFLHVCGGGCGAETYAISGDFSNKSHYCEAKKGIFNRIKSDLVGR